MKSYKRYIQAIEDFHMRAIDPFQGALVDGNYRFGDIGELDSLKGFVLKELTHAAPGNIRLKLKKLREENSILMDFDKNYAELYTKSRENLLDSNDLAKYLTSFDALDKQKLEITPEYLKTIYRSVLDRQKSLLDLINRIEDLLAGL